MGTAIDGTWAERPHNTSVGWLVGYLFSPGIEAELSMDYAVRVTLDEIPRAGR